MAMTRDEVAYMAVYIFGKHSQMQMAIEEMSELTKAICKYFRYPMDKEVIENIVEEIADVQIMIDQMKMIFDDTTNIERKKRERLEKLIGEVRRK